jgi:hypothetical protein
LQPHHSLFQSIARPEVFARAIDRILDSSLRDDSGELALLRRDRELVAARLAGEIEARTWRQLPVRRKRAVLDKPRDIVALPVLDRIVHGAIAAELSARLELVLPETLYSYRPRRGQRLAIGAIANALREYKLRNIPVRERGLFAIRFDVTSYGDSIPVHPDSELWTLLGDVLAAEDPWLVELLHRMVRCDDPSRRVGVPVGSPLANPLTNIYLADLDRELAALAVMSGRFGDDCIVLCDSESAAVRARELIAATLARKQLALSPHKYLEVYWNGAGRTGPGGWKGATHVAFVGIDIEFTGTTRLKAARRADLLAAVGARIARLSRLLLPKKPQTREDAVERARQLCTALQPAFDRKSPFALPELDFVAVAGACRVQLAQIDREIAVAVASAATRRKGPSAFRLVRWRSLYGMGLPSLVKLRNHGVT